MERRAASHTEEEEMNQRRRLLNAAKKGDQKAVAKLFELYQVRVYSSEMVNRLNRSAGTHKLQSHVGHKRPVKGGAGARRASQKKTRIRASKARSASTSKSARRKHKPHKKK